MKKLLFILVGLIGAYVVVDAKSSVKITASVNPSGVATVTVGSKSSTTTTADQDESSDGVFGIGASDAKLKVSVSNIASNYYFTGWELLDSNIGMNGSGYDPTKESWTYKLGRKTNRTEEHTVRANFSPYWDFSSKAIFVSVDNGQLETTIGEVSCSLYDLSGAISATLADGDLLASDFSISDPTIDTEGKSIFTIEYTGTGKLDEVKNKYVYVKLKGKVSDGKEKNIDVKVSLIEAPILTFIATDKGTYTVESLFADWNGTGENKIEIITDPSQLLNVPLVLTSDPIDKYIFWGWRIDDGVNEPEIFQSYSIRKDFLGSATIEPIFIPNTGGYMVMVDNGQEDTYVGLGDGFYYKYWKYGMTPLSMHYDLQEALDVATENQFVVFENLATIFSKFGITPQNGYEQPSDAMEAILPSRDGGYTIPEGVTLLIPASADYAYGMDKMDRKCYQAGSSLTQYRKLVISKNTKITVNGNLCVFAYLTSTSGIPGSPNACGVIELKDGAHIEVNGRLYSYGYIINPEGTQINATNLNQIGKITANSTAEIYETFQMADWRGGNATSGMLNNDKKVFPINQYYIQNIEVPITFYKGSTETLSTAVDITGLGTLVAESYFILPNSNSNSGFFKLGDNTSVVKYYDAKKDRLHFLVNGNSLDSYASIENVYLPISGYEVNSKDYVLAVTNNMDIALNNVTLDVKYDMCLLAGSTLQVNPNAKVRINGTDKDPASVFVYDVEWKTRNGNGSGNPDNGGYFGTSNSSIVPLTKRPGGISSRTIDADASLIVDGMLEIGQYGELYTTAKGDIGPDGTYGADISSKENGRIKFMHIGTSTTTYQAIQTDNTISAYLNIPVTSALLKNKDNTFVETADERPGKIFVYDGEKWTAPQWTLPTFNITLPTTTIGNQNVGLRITDQEKNATVWNVTIEGAGFSIDGTNTTTSVTYDVRMGDNIEFPIHYRAQNIHGDHSATITVSHGGDSYSTTITANENYTPTFSVVPASFDLGETYIGTPLEKTVGAETFQIKQTDNNVTSLISNDDYYQSLSWKASSTNPEFTLEFGDGKRALSNAKITFSSTYADTKTATITLTATYKDKNNQQISNTEEIKINVSATAKDLLDNGFALTSDCQNELKAICVNIPVTLEFEGLTSNTKPLELIFENNGDPAVLSYEGEGTQGNPFVVTANSVPATMPTIKIRQQSDGEYAECETEPYATSIQNCSPTITWNWDDLYFGENFENPITSNSDGEITLTLTKLMQGVNEITGDELTKVINYSDKVARIGSNLTGEYEATFSFSQAKGSSHSAYSTTFTSVIYARPNVLDLCVESERIFKGVTTAQNNVAFEEDNKVVFQNGAFWTMHFVGVPDILTFTPTATTQLQIQESNNGTSWGSAFYGPVTGGTLYSVELLPTTRYLKFTVVNATVLQNVCIAELNRVKSDTEILYMPIFTDPVNNPTTRNVTFTYVSDKDLEIRFSSNNISAQPERLAKTDAGTYGQVTVVVSSTETSEQALSMTIQREASSSGTGEIKLTIPIETYRFPQKLPIQLESGKDEAKRFHYIASSYKDVEWDASNYSINLKKQTSDPNDKPYIVFAFDGAPSFISFVPLVDNVNWEIKESKNGAVWGVCENPTIEDGVLKQTLQYTSQFVRVTYVGANMDIVKLTKLNILSDQSAIPNPEELNLTEENKYKDNLAVGADLNVTTVNLTNMTIAVDNPNFTLSYGSNDPTTTFTLDKSKIDNVFGEDVVGQIPFKVFWDASQATDFATIMFTTIVDEQVKTLATVQLTASTTSLGAESALYTGVNLDEYTLAGDFSGIYAVDGADGVARRPVNLANTYDAAGKPLFDYLIIYGETTAAEGEVVDGKVVITTPTTSVGSNAKTPIYVYRRKGGVYEFAMMQENANASDKVMSIVSITDGPEPTRIYITGFCPYASTGYTKEEEGVWYFQGENGAKLDIYLDDCYIYSRNKTQEGRAFNGRYDGQAFSEGYVRGSGGVLVFENQDNDNSGSFDVTIHTINNNMLKSNYGCFFELMKGMRAFQVSSPIQVHLAGEAHKGNSKTTITFDDKWPTDATNYMSTKRTNGCLSLQKQHNNAPSIDLGNANTVVNFAGGQVELQNASIVSLNYKTTLAISFRSGLMAGFPMAYGIGTDDVGGRVNFIDGTTTVIPMDIDPKFKDFYLLDVDAAGEPVTSGEGANLKYLTSCLRCPTNTVVTGGSHCMLRACEDVTSKGGAPVDESGELVGLYKYPRIKGDAPRGGWTDKNDGLVNPNEVPAGYNVESVTPNNNGTTIDDSDDYLNFWFTKNEESTVKPEVDKTISFWKACMTEISAEYMSYGGTVGGETKIFPNEEIKYLLYCRLDENISNVITAGSGTGEDKVFTYQAPVKDPTGQWATPYLTITPSYVGSEWQNYIETVQKDGESGTVNTGEDYTITDKIYYVVPATADVWMTFTAPFNVEKLWIMETYNEKKLAETPEKDVTDEFGNTTRLNNRESVLLEQAKHNADFAAFFGVAMALDRQQTFDEIYNDYIGWAKIQDNYNPSSGVDYMDRGKVRLHHYNGTNFYDAHYYLYENTGEWTWTGTKYDTQWEVVGAVAEGEVLMHQGQTYSMLFPYCMGCDVQKDSEGNVLFDANGLPMPSYSRDYWDYWSGKFLIFESTLAKSGTPHTIKGSNYHTALFAPAMSGDGDAALLTGNSTFALMTSNESVDEKIYSYVGTLNLEGFDNLSTMEGDEVVYQTIEPTISFLIADVPSVSGMPAKRITRDGRIVYDESGNGNQNGTTGGRIPTVGGGNDLFVTSIAGGINVAVAAPQNVRVLSSTGAVIYSGYIQTAVDIKLPTNGIYIVSGENEVQKILY